MGLFGKKAEVRFVTEKEHFQPGDFINVTSDIEVSKNFDVDEIRAEIVCTRNEKRVVREYDKTRKTWRTYTKINSARIFHDRKNLEGKTKLSSGDTKSYNFSFQLPVDAQPTYRSHRSSGVVGDRWLDSIQWELKIVIGIKWRPDIVERTILKVLSGMTPTQPMPQPAYTPQPPPPPYGAPVAPPAYGAPPPPQYAQPPPMYEQPPPEPMYEPAPPPLDPNVEGLTCPNCGSAIPPGQRFCGQCGQRLA